MPQPASVEQLTYGEGVVLQFVPPGESAVPLGVLLYQPDSDQLLYRLRPDLESCAPEAEELFLEGLAGYLDSEIEARGGGGFLAWLEEHASHSLTSSPRERVLIGQPEAALARFYREHVPSAVQPYRTHLPLFTLRAAAGHFSGQQTSEPEGWIEVTGRRLKPGQFVATVVGRSMLPLIPDGSLCVFEAPVTGSRQGRLVLVENRTLGGGERYTVKRYRSEKVRGEDGGWRHERIILEPLNPEFEAWELNEDDDLAVIAEFQYVLES